MERMVFAVTRGGSFSASAVDTKMSIPGRSDSPLGFLRFGPEPSNLSLRTARLRLITLIITDTFIELFAPRTRPPTITNTIQVTIPANSEPAFTRRLRGILVTPVQFTHRLRFHLQRLHFQASPHVRTCHRVKSAGENCVLNVAVGRVSAAFADVERAVRGIVYGPVIRSRRNLNRVSHELLRALFTHGNVSPAGGGDAVPSTRRPPPTAERRIRVRVRQREAPNRTGQAVTCTA
nr:hypothetical protein MA16_Dca020941 [Ipomoea trifida]